jgi:hypothetical protein
MILIKYIPSILGLISAIVSYLMPQKRCLFLSLAIVSFGFQIVVVREDIANLAKSKFVGILSGKPKIIFSATDNILPKLQIGDKGAIFSWAGPNGKAIFNFFNENPLVIMIENGQLKVSTSVRDMNGVLIAEIVKNEWKVAPSQAWDRNYTKNALEVKNSKGEIVLQVKLVNSTVQLQGVFYASDGSGICIAQKETGDTIFQLLGLEYPTPNFKIEPIFEYPSDLHLGVLRKSE